MGGPSWQRKALKADQGSFWTRSLDESLFGASPAKQERRARFVEAMNEENQFERLKRMHCLEVPDATRPVAPAPRLADRRALYRTHAREARKGIRIWRRAERRAAEALALDQASAEADALDEQARREAEERQVELDRGWEALQRNEPSAVLEALSAAFEHFRYPKVALAVLDGGGVVFFHFIDYDIPERQPDLTPTGRLTARKIKKSDRNFMSSEVIASATILAARMILAANSASKHGTAVALQDGSRMEYDAVAWLRLDREAKARSLVVESNPLNALIRAGGHFDWKANYALRKATFTEWPELGKLTKSVERGHFDLLQALDHGVHPSGALVRID